MAKKICKKCGDPVTGITVDGSYKYPRNRTSCFNCVPFGTSPYSRRPSPEEKRKRNNEKHRRYSRKYTKLYGKHPMYIRYRKRREAVIKIIGDACQVCGYDKYSSNLVFHHLDPDGKDHGLSLREFQLAPDRVLDEISKTVMVCHNCHGEIHGDLCDLPLEPLNEVLQAKLMPIKNISWYDLVIASSIPKSPE